MTDLIAQRKARGAFFTPPEMAAFLAKWGIRTANDRILEPSCGEAEFLLAAGARLRSLGADFFGGNLVGIEIHEPSAKAARERAHTHGFAPEILVADFFDLRSTAEYDVVIGNPPYIRYQDFSGSARLKAQEAALKHGVRLNNLISSWAPFVVHAAGFVTPQGRLGLVLPAELLAVKYAAEVRRYLLNRFGSVRLVMFEELVFPGVLEEVVLLLAEGTGPAEHFEVYQARNLDDLDHIEGATWIPYSPGREDKWVRALLPPETLGIYKQITSGSGFEELIDWGETYLGIVTGNNRYFTLSAAAAEQSGLDDSELIRISPPGSRHLRGISFSEGDWEDLSRSGYATYLFAPDPVAPSKAALRYIEAGKLTGVHNAYKCRVRTPWWRVPSVPVADLLLTYMDQQRPRLLANRAMVHHLNSIYGVTLRDERKALAQDLLPIAALNTVTGLGAELVGRAYGGGLLKLEPKEADRLPMPSVALLEKVQAQLYALDPQVQKLLGRGELECAVQLVDEVLLVEGLGLNDDHLNLIRDARELLFNRRRARSSRGNVKN